MNEQQPNPNEYKVVSFHNSTDFRFTPEMGCMYNGRAVNGADNEPGIAAGETRLMRYDMGQQLALNLAKAVMLRSAPKTDVANAPQGVSLWSEDGLQKLKASFVSEVYSEERPKAMSEADMLFQKMEELNKLKDKLEQRLAETEPKEVTSGNSDYQDKAEVIAELEKRGIQHDKRKNKAELEKLLA